MQLWQSNCMIKIILMHYQWATSIFFFGFVNQRFLSDKNFWKMLLIAVKLKQPDNPHCSCNSLSWDDIYVAFQVWKFIKAAGSYVALSILLYVVPYNPKDTIIPRHFEEWCKEMQLQIEVPDFCFSFGSSHGNVQNIVSVC